MVSFFHGVPLKIKKENAIDLQKEMEKKLQKRQKLSLVLDLDST
jgi:TFIIF-interacting CTD phosphatase-like protein